MHVGVKRRSARPATLSYGGDTLNTADYLAKPNFVCVVGNWVAGAKDTANQDRKCIDVVSLRRQESR